MKQGILEVIKENKSDRNIMFKDRRNGALMGLASALNLIGKDPQLQELYEVCGHGSDTYIKAKDGVESLG